MGTIECEAMIQDGNLMFNQFRKVLCKHVEFSTGSGFKITYPQYEKRHLEMGARSSPEPIFGVYADENGTGEVENCRHYSTSVAQELLYAVESHVLDAGATRELAFPQRELEVVVGLDHGQGALSGFARFLLTPKELRKEKGNLSYGCPVVKVCHVKCKHDTYRIIKNTVAQTLNDSYKQLK